MAVQQLNFQGINRAITDYSSTTACEELINLRPTGTGLVPVKPFSVKMAGVQYKKVFVHKSTNKTNYIGVYGERDTTYVKLLDDNGQAITTLFTISPAQVGQLVPFDNVIATMRFAYVGNYILFSFNDKEDGFYANYAFLWNGEEYKRQEANIPSIDVSYDFSAPELLISPVEPTWDGETPDSEIKQQIASGLNAIEEENKEHCLGPVVVAIAFKTRDGQTFWTGRWFICDPFPIPEQDQAPESGEFPTGYVVDENSQIAQFLPTYFDNHVYGLEVGSAVQSSTDRLIQAAGRKLTFDIKLDGTTWEEESSFIQSIEIYSSRPAVHVDPINAWGEKAEAQGEYTTVYKHVILPQVQYEIMELDKQLLYFQKSIRLDELKTLGAAGKQVTLEFGGNIQTTRKTLEVDAGSVSRYGSVMAYNARFHYFDSHAKVYIGMPDFQFRQEPETTQDTDVFVVYNDGQKDIGVYCGIAQLPDHSSETAVIVIAPSLRVKQVITQQPAGSDYPTSRVYPMISSSRYTYSIFINGDVDESRVAMYSSDYTENYALLDEPSSINVTEQYNPFVFKVEHSYFAPGKVLDIQPQMVAVRDVSFGDYPLNVFTDRGVYALLQGSGTVLYGNFRAISNLITTANSIPTEIGTFFIAAGGLWMIAGDNAVLISDALSLGPHKFLRDCAGFQAIEAQAVPVDNLLSDPTFEDYVNGATLSYNRFRDELIVSNTDYFYSYVLSLKYRQWFKIGVKMIQDVPGSNVATVPLPGNTLYNIVDFSDETEDVKALVHLQSRPFSFSGYMYSHIHRAISMVRAALSNTDVLVISLYGSDDLQEWVLLSYAGQSSKSPDTPLCISQLRTPPAARSWRYYTICIGGTIPTDTDFGPVMLEYQPVIRRLG